MAPLLRGMSQDTAAILCLSRRKMTNIFMQFRTLTDKREIKHSAATRDAAQARGWHQNPTPAPWGIVRVDPETG